MRYVDILAGFEQEINKLDDVFTKPDTDESLYWLNQAVGKFVKLRFNGDTFHHTGYELTEKRRADLVKLFTQCSKSLEDMVKIEHATYDEYKVEYPTDFLFSLNEDVVIVDTEGNNAYDTHVFECTQDSFMHRVNNSLTDFHYRHHKARPLRIRYDEGCKLLTDKNYTIQEYTLGYIKTPTVISLDDPLNEYTDFEDIIMSEIIKMAAQMYLENKKDERYQTISGEVLTQE